MSIATRLLHAIPVDEQTGAIAVPIYQTSTYVQEAPGVNKGFDYARTGNPTRLALENLVAELEGGHSGYAFASGLAAIDAVVKLLSAGDQIVAIDDIYGGAFRLFEHVYRRLGIDIVYCDTTVAENVAATITEKTKLIWLESPSNPTLKVSDIAAISAIAKAHNCLLCVDNTFASPILQRPIELGADIVVHSGTKYLGGHSDLIAGIAVAKTPEIAKELKFIQNASGGILGPFDCFLVIRGIETLPLRIERASKSALAVAKFLETRPEVARVYYPGLESHPNYEIAQRQQPDGHGGIVALALAEDTIEAATKLVTSTKYFKLAESLGGAKSLLCHPATMTHKSTPVDQRRAAGVCDGLVRLSVGLEDAEDLIADLAQALDQLAAAKAAHVVTKEGELEPALA
ncbi:aminotransferase class I/II-fold pyridoxal phosphate-dependent enzyme [Hymenobacter sp. HMF4947]|uniref:Aminotransferase class I/II-fold pyridoxal phosphate-dependent enzyme n=1 Tax=Hymenobacter ginkgonis TaxID=2682976 RepID=A0A7K1TAC4_9BACT|nr:PLP-dependent aspartate aminotransferase family protein [Hymenobacter ginkgonis]MVN75131.1 aminotransferase class I/II-fold pyridoxal phosphate-dependent enzyme [Hymenobacter ginkgonis]